jgi:general secretion pathway protein G
MKITPRTGKAAFTLIEVMAVITIIVILAGLVVGGMGFVTERQAKEKAKVQIALLSKAIEEYKLDMGKYPGSADSTPATGLITAELYDRLFYQGY